MLEKIKEIIRKPNEIREKQLRLLSKRKGLIADLEKTRRNYDITIWKQLENYRKIREKEDETKQSEEYLAEVEEKNRVSYLEKIIKENLKDLRLEEKELSTHRNSFYEEMHVLKELIQTNKDEAKLLQ